MACYNPLLADERTRKRRALLEATEQRLTKLAREVARRTKTPLVGSTIGSRAGKILERYKMGKHFALTIADGTFRWARREESIAAEAQLDGIYVIRTSEPPERISADDTVRTYVEWHMRRALAPILFEDDQLATARTQRDPIRPAEPTTSAKRKKATHPTLEGLPVHSFETLMAEGESWSQYVSAEGRRRAPHVHAGA